MDHVTLRGLALYKDIQGTIGTTTYTKIVFNISFLSRYD